jgi:hypothetical protein
VCLYISMNEIDEFRQNVILRRVGFKMVPNEGEFQIEIINFCRKMSSYETM